MTARFQDFAFKWSVAVVAFAAFELGTLATPTLFAMTGALH